MKELKGDILLLNEGIICHQVNCLGIMGGGLAKQVKEKYPDVFKSYKETCLKHLNISSKDYYVLGKIQICTINENLLIANIFAQGDIGNGKQTNYDALDSALEQLQLFTRENSLNVYFPKYMGCGLGGGRWDIYSAIIKSYFPTGTIVDYEKEKIPYDPNEYEEYKSMSITNYES